MIIRKLDGAGDWTFGKGLSSYASAELGIEENIKSRIFSWFGDCFFAAQEGIDWLNLLDKGQSENLQLAIKSMILTSYGVIGINNISSVLDSNRQITITFSIDTIYGSNYRLKITQGVPNA